LTRSARRSSSTRRLQAAGTPHRDERVDVTDLGSRARLTRNRLPPRRSPPRVRPEGCYPLRPGAAPLLCSRERCRRSHGHTPVSAGVVGRVVVRAVSGACRELVETVRTPDDVTALEVAVDAPRATGAASVTEKFPVLLHGDETSVTEAHAGTPPIADLSLFK